MRKLTKILSLVFVFMLSLVLAACGSNTTANKTQNPSQPTQPSQPATSATTAKPVEY